MMIGVENLIYGESRFRGAIYTTGGVAGAGLVGHTVGRTFPGLVGLSLVATGGAMLGRTAAAVGDRLTEGDLPGARDALPALVGRDPAMLDEFQIARAVVESVAENTVDAIVAPALWAGLLGGVGVAGYRGINTMDAMVGHRNDRYQRFGWASARLDDVANLIPARLTAVLVALVRPTRAGDVLRLVRRDARAHPSPNGGVAETAFAAALGIRLGGTNDYGNRTEYRGVLGDGPRASAADIGRSVRLSRDVSLATAALCAGSAMVAATAARKKGR